jgi:prevent-host-death family protein
MRTVNIGELRNQLSAYLQVVRSGEEVVVKDRNVPVARILPIRAEDQPRDYAAEQAQLVAAGVLKLPEQEMDWDAFWARPKANVSHEVAVKAAIDARGDR